MRLGPLPQRHYAEVLRFVGACMPVRSLCLDDCVGVRERDVSELLRALRDLEVLRACRCGGRAVMDHAVALAVAQHGGTLRELASDTVYALDLWRAPLPVLRRLELENLSLDSAVSAGRRLRDLGALMPCLEVLRCVLGDRPGEGVLMTALRTFPRLRKLTVRLQKRWDRHVEEPRVAPAEHACLRSLCVDMRYSGADMPCGFDELLAWLPRLERLALIAPVGRSVLKRMLVPATCVDTLRVLRTSDMLSERDVLDVAVAFPRLQRLGYPSYSREHVARVRRSLHLQLFDPVGVRRHDGHLRLEDADECAEAVGAFFATQGL